MLVIEVEYLLGRAFAADFRNREEPEWPPHAERLFSALVAAHHDTYGSIEERAAIEWFERLAPPQVAAGERGAGGQVGVFVPTNYAGKSGSTHPEQRGKQPRVFPAQGPSSPVVHFIWPDADPEYATRMALRGLLERVASLGRACSLVRMTLADIAPEPNHLPDDDGEDVMRVFGEGRVAELEARFAADQRPQSGPQQRYRQATPQPIAIATSHFGELVIFRKTAGCSLPIEGALTLTSAVRRAVIRIAEESGALCDMLSGHGAHPHCAFLALPFAGLHEHADGRLMGFAIALPRNISREDRKKVLRTSADIEEINVREVLGNWRVEMTGFETPTQATLRNSTWTRPSTIWSSVTPILLDRFPKKNLSVESILAQACERTGLPAPIEIEHGPYSELAGVAPVPQFRLARTKDERPRWGVHATLRFEAPVKGPVLVGAGRYFGLGLMQPVREGSEDDR